MQELTYKQQAVMKVIAYLAVFDCPLTAMEIRDYLEVTIDPVELNLVLAELVASGWLQTKHGFYGLEIEKITERQTRFTYSRRKLKKARLIAMIFSRLPWVRLIALANQIGRHNLRESGDLDFLIICSPSRIWLTRLITAGLMALTSQRPTANKSRDQICLSFFVTSDSLNFEPYLLGEEDLYFRYWLAGLRVLYDADNYYQRLVAANQQLTVKLPNWLAHKKDLMSNVQDGGWQCLEWLGGLEAKARTWQMARLPAELKAAQASGQVVINDQVLKLHTQDRRAQFMSHYQKICSNLKPIYVNND